MPCIFLKKLIKSDNILLSDWTTSGNVGQYTLSITNKDDIARVYQILIGSDIAGVAIPVRFLMMSQSMRN